MPYERDNIHRLTPYTPGEQPQRADVVKLNTNENPYPPPAAVLEAIRRVSADQLRRYPPPRAQPFREAAARLHGLSPEQVIATNGGDELLRMAVTVFCEPGGRGLGETYPTYSLYDVLADIHGTSITQVPLEDDWSVPEDFAARLNDHGCRLGLLVNPHAPSGRREPLDKLERLARAFRGVLLIDEAYVDFAEGDATPLLDPERGLDNVLLLRTLSKGYSLAGLRFGYGLGHPRLIEALDKARDSYNTDILSQAAATAALSARDEARESWKKVIAERARLAGALRQLGFSVAPSQTNFLLAAPPGDGLSAQALYRALHDRAIFVRYWDAPRLHDKLRITVGTPEQDDALLGAIAEILREGAGG
ncbi:histidinol-phosphate aminotransferase [Sorangium cellulosum]|uniref:Histidinol-phosphate aminotransferase n=1 Tax=Sorangium cellulosum TaxID=56 RepID=A0A4P2QDI7_SORCE|nr:histidinol-phosphate transaminase [Sorangium cellulosum]AUX27458.1 histidinol-phosphate aminotransferase [Sorangium cellulosum]